MSRIHVKREELLKNLAILLEQDKIKIPNDEGLISELESMRYELGDRGKLHLKVPDGMTDDRIMSLALAVWDAKKTKSFETEMDWINKMRAPKDDRGKYEMFQL